MIKYVTLFLLTVYSYSGSAQQMIFSEDFESFPGYYITGWTHSYTGAVPWQAGEPYLVGGLCNDWPGSTKVAGISDCGAFNYNNSDVLTATPAISMQNVSGAWLQYDSYFSGYGQGANIEKATVEVSADGGNNWDTIQIVPANPVTGLFTTYYLDLSAYNNLNDIKIGFRYSDDMGHLKGWAIDNVKVFVPSAKDLMLESVGPTDSLLTYAALNTGIIHQGTIFNYGLDTVSSFVVKYQQVGGSVRPDTFSGVQIPPFSRYNFTHSIPDTVLAAGKLPVTIWVELQGDGDHSNDTLHTFIRGSYFMPSKKLVIEEGTGTFDLWGPRGIVYMNNAFENDPDICPISVHGNGGDPMGLPDYSEYLYYLHWNYVPYFLFDRRQNISADSFFSAIERQKHYFGFADIRLEGGISNGQLTVQAHVKSAVDMTGDFRLALIVTEDGVTGTTAAYNQKNRYAGGAYGPMGGYENKPNPVPAADMHYNFVARSANPDPAGDSGILPAALEHGVEYDQALTTAIDPTWDQTKLKAHVLLIRHDDSSVLNSNTLPFYLTIKEPAQASLSAGIYPNPARDQVTLYFSLNNPGRVAWAVADISGRTLVQSKTQSFSAGRHEIPIAINGLRSGIYLVSLVSETIKTTLKIVVQQ